MEHDKDVIEKTALEDLSPADYYTECCAFLDDFLAKRPKLAGAEVREVLTSLLNVLLTEPDLRNFDALATMRRLVSPFFLDNQSSLGWQVSRSTFFPSSPIPINLRTRLPAYL